MKKFSSYMSIIDGQFLRQRFVDKTFGFILLLNLTNLFIFFAPLFKVRIAYVSIIILIINILYIVFYYESLKSLMGNRQIIFWFVFLVVWPCIAATYAPKISFREIGLQLYYFTLFLATIIYIKQNGFKCFHQIATAAILVTFVGLLLSLYKIEIFEGIALLADKRISFQGRAFGFFMQPNEAAMNINILFISWHAMIHKSKAYISSISCFFWLVLVVLTGSRGGFLLAIGILIVILLNSVIKRKNNIKNILKNSVPCLFLIVLFFLSLPLISIVLQSTLPDHKGKFDIMARIKSISKLDIAARSSQNKSTLEGRLEHMEDFIKHIKEKPLLGFGFGSKNIFKKEGKISESSHNQYLKLVFETGVFRLLFYLLLLLYLFKNPNRKILERDSMQTNSYIQLILLILFAGMISNAVLNSRVLYCVLGAFIALLIWPEAFNPNYKIKSAIQNHNF